MTESEGIAILVECAKRAEPLIKDLEQKRISKAREITLLDAQIRRLQFLVKMSLDKPR